MSLFTREEALYYHSTGKKGKLEVIPIKPCANQKYLSMAYSPGVAEACREIVKDPLNSFEYTARGNLVAVISNGSAVLGLGNIGPLAGKPVMEGKGVLFKTFADVDCYDINLDISDPDKLIEMVKALEPTFGGINLEDIKAPECFYIENKLKDLMDIPVFHDDQHGTAIISGAGLINGMQIFNKKAEDLKVVIVGAGAAGIACAKFYCSLGIDKQNIYMFDSQGLIHQGRSSDLNAYKQEFAQKIDHGTLNQVIKNADVFLGLSQPNLLSQDMVRSMGQNPIIFAMSNPDPEITYPDAKKARPECIMGTGRSDFPNQVNNVSGFPYIFRGALDVRAKTINEDMKLAAAKALADLAREPVPEEIKQAYKVKELSFGPDYIIPKPLDHRVLEWEAHAVAQAAMQTGVARKQIDLQTYSNELKNNMQASLKRINNFIKAYHLDI